jgi:hypothetical protein
MGVLVDARAGQVGRGFDAGEGEIKSKKAFRPRQKIKREARPQKAPLTLSFMRAGGLNGAYKAA